MHLVIKFYILQSPSGPNNKPKIIFQKRIANFQGYPWLKPKQNKNKDTGQKKTKTGLLLWVSVQEFIKILYILWPVTYTFSNIGFPCPHSVRKILADIPIN